MQLKECNKMGIVYKNELQFLSHLVNFSHMWMQGHEIYF